MQSRKRITGAILSKYLKICPHSNRKLLRKEEETFFLHLSMTFCGKILPLKQPSDLMLRDNRLLKKRAFLKVKPKTEIQGNKESTINYDISILNF